MFTRQDLLNAVQKNIPQAYTIAGINDQTKTNYWDQWVKDGLSTQRNRWLNQYNMTGWNNQLANSILLYFQLNSIGYDSYQNTHQAYGDQLRAYVAIAQGAYDMACAMVTSLQIQIHMEKDAAKLANLQNQLHNEQATALANAANLRTQKDTLAAALKSGSAI